MSGLFCTLPPPKGGGGEGGQSAPSSEGPMRNGVLFRMVEGVFPSGWWERLVGVELFLEDCGRGFPFRYYSNVISVCVCICLCWLLTGVYVSAYV